MPFHDASQRCSSTACPNGAVPRCVTTVMYYDVIPHTHLRQHFNPISSPESAARHAWATLPRLSVARKHSGRPFREQNAPFRSRDNLGRPSREQNVAFHSRDCRERHTRQPRRFFSELRGLHGNSTGALRALLDAAEVRPEPVGLVIGLSAFRNRHLDG